MPDIKVVAVAKVIEGAMKGDLDKVKSYAELIAKDLENSGEVRASEIIKNALSPNKNNNICILDNIE